MNSAPAPQSYQILSIWYHTSICHSTYFRMRWTGRCTRRILHSSLSPKLFMQWFHHERVFFHQFREVLDFALVFLKPFASIIELTLELLDSFRVMFFIALVVVSNPLAACLRWDDMEAPENREDSSLSFSVSLLSRDAKFSARLSFSARTWSYSRVLLFSSARDSLLTRKVDCFLQSRTWSLASANQIRFSSNGLFAL